MNAAAQNHILPERRHKFGDVREDGRMFVQYKREILKKCGSTAFYPVFVTPESFHKQKSAVKKWNKANKARRLDTRLKKAYGVSLEFVETRKAVLGGKCEICRSKSLLVVDHDHQTGKFRGLLCQLCNKAIGLLKDDPEKLGSAINYLKTHQQKTC